MPRPATGKIAVARLDSREPEPPPKVVEAPFKSWPAPELAVVGPQPAAFPQGTAAPTRVQAQVVGVPMVVPDHDPVATAVWKYGSASIGALLLGFLLAGGTGAIAVLAAVIAVVLVAVVRRN